MAVVIDANNFASFAYINPYIRYCAEDYYDDPWVLNERRVVDHELIYITRGTGSFTLGDSVYNVKPGDLILIKPDTLNSGRSVSVPFSFLCIHFDIYVSTLKTDFQTEQKVFHEPFPLKPVRYVKATVGCPEYTRLFDTNSFHTAFKRLLNENIRHQPGSMPILKAYFIEMLVSIFRQTSGIQTTVRQYSPEVSSVMTFISEKYMRRIYLEDLGRHVHLQPSYLSSIFKKQTGHSITEYITLFRLVKAKEYLLESNRKLDDIAMAIGFYDLHHFIRVFKKYENYTPSQYRQLNER